ncbi:MAG: galactokinase, partial [Promethearchaeota archaeon]
MKNKNLLIDKHKEIFGEVPELIVHSPGRVNLIGEHTDYNDGYVLPMAISLGIDLAISRIADSEVIAVYSLDKEKKIVSLYSYLMKSSGSDDWANYPIGVVKVLQKQGHKFGGVRVSFTGSIPQGAGLSSSAALEVAVAFAVQQLYNLKIKDKDLVKYCQQAEQEVVGVRCGIMDQFTAKFG